MNKKYLIFGLVSLLVLGAIVILLLIFWNKPIATPTPPTPPVGNDIVPTTPVEEYVPKDGAIQPLLPIEQQADFIIDITSAGFSPESLKISRGQSIIWTNRDRYGEHGIQSIGNKYPESGNCGTKMDTCVSMKLGESFRFTFERAGTWEYQDPERTQFKGTIVVE